MRHGLRPLEYQAEHGRRSALLRARDSSSGQFAALRRDPRASGFHSFGETCAIKPGAKPIIGMTAISLSIEIKPNAAPDLGLTIIESQSDE